MSRRRLPAEVERTLDRIEDRLYDAPEGFHRPGPPATAAKRADAGLPDTEAAFYERWNGIVVAGGDAEILPLERIGAATRSASDLLRPGDRLVGTSGRDLLVLPEDPWEEGASVVLVDEGGDRWPEATSVARLVLGWLAEAAVLYDEEGEFRDGVVGDDGDLVPSVRRKILRRRLDVDPDAPAPRLRLARSLQDAGEFRAAEAELRRVVHLAPAFVWAWFELGNVRLVVGRPAEACAAFERAAQALRDPDLAAQAWAHAAMAAARAKDRDGARALAARARTVQPGLPAHLEAAVRDALDTGHDASARRLLEIGLCVAPGRPGLLALARRVPPVEEETSR